MSAFSVDKKLRKAKAFFQNGNVLAAQYECKEILEKFPKNQRTQNFLKKISGMQKYEASVQQTQQSIKKLIQLYNNKEYQELIIKALIELERYPNSYLIWNLLGAANLALDKPQEASLAFKRVTELNSKYAEGFNNLGVSLNRLSLYQDASEAYENAIKINPKNPEVFENLGSALMNNGEFERASAILWKSVKLNPKNINALMYLGTALASQNKIEEAFEIFDSVLKLEPKNAEIHYNIGSIFQDIGSFENAVDAYSAAISLQCDYVDAWYNLGLTFRSQGNNAEAIQSFKKTIHLEPDHPEANHLLSALLGKTTKNAPKEYIERLFNSAANSFEDTLLGNLDYKIPKIITMLIREENSYKNFDSTLDLGCGTGLVGRELEGTSQFIDGVDLSQSMLKKALEKKSYRNLINADVLEYLRKAHLDYDYFVAADVFIYVGDLSELFDLISSRNERTGKLVFSTEHSEIKGYHLEKSGRYSHSKSYIEALCKKYRFSINHFSTADLRKENGVFLKAGIYSLSF